jgi:ubiquinone/menaquinone biosynthesis C-methylase UbiE
MAFFTTEPSESLGRKLVSRIAVPRGPLGWLVAWMMPMAHRPIYELTADALELRPDDYLLEVACGSGSFIRDHAKHVHRVAGLDLSGIQIWLATRRNRPRVQNGTAEFVAGDAAHLPWDDNTFSVVTCMGSFTWFAEPLESLQEMHRVLAPGGRALIGVETNAEDGADHTTESERWGLNIWTEADVRRLMAAGGFEEIAVSYATTKDHPAMMHAGGRKR